MYSKEKIIEQINEFENLPVLPTIVEKVMEMIENENTSANDISNLIKNEQALVLKIMQTANSAFYGFPRQISSLHRAITIIGFNGILNLILGFSISNTFKHWNLSLEDVEKFWIHSASTAGIAKIIARISKKVLPDEAFIIGLSHDIGKMILKSNFKKEYEEIIILQKKESLPINIAEKKIIGLDHAEIGSILAKKWNLPKRIVDSIALHHSQSGIPHRFDNVIAMASIIHIADKIANLKGLICPSNELVSIFNSTYTLNIGLSFSNYEKIISNIDTEIDNIINIFTDELKNPWKSNISQKNNLNIMVLSNENELNLLFKVALLCQGCHSIDYDEDEEINSDKIDFYLIADKWGYEKSKELNIEERKKILYPSIALDDENYDSIFTISPFVLDNLLQNI